VGKKPSQAFCEPRPCEFPLPANDFGGETECSLCASLLNIANVRVSTTYMIGVNRRYLDSKVTRNSVFITWYQVM
jgi:hypothetical protein